MTSRSLTVLGISGSLRQGSYNTALLEACRPFLPAGVDYTICVFRDLPLYEASLDGETKPAPVEALRAAIVGADALLIATPEYNYSVPGGLKNAIDWASRPGFKSPLAHKPTGMLSASRSPVGGARAHGHLKQILSSTLSPVYPAPEFVVGDVTAKLDANGTITDGPTLEKLERYVRGFAAWIEGLVGERES